MDPSIQVIFSSVFPSPKVIDRVLTLMLSCTPAGNFGGQVTIAIPNRDKYIDIRFHWAEIGSHTTSS